MCCEEVDSSELYTFLAEQIFCHFIDLADFSSEYNYLHTVVSIEVNMGGAYCLQQEGMLQVCEFLHQLCGVVVVNDTHHCDGFGIWVSQVLFAYFLAYKVAYGFGAVLVAPFCYQPVEAGKQFFIQ